ncbi:MAG: TlpA family protein disulfide reductase [Deltaproteobacteria bacterium]|nr:TlpA family protein disulfide reductase [Deltaproteobacteria bacterium]
MFRRVLIFLLLLSITDSSFAVGINEKAPDFTLPDMNNRQVSLNDFKGKVVFIDFWATWCPPCKKEMPELAKFVEKYPDVVVLAISIDKITSHVEKFFKKDPSMLKKLTVLLDPDASVLKLYGAVAMPTSYWVDKQGNIRYVHFGFNESDPIKWATEAEYMLK